MINLKIVNIIFQHFFGLLLFFGSFIIKGKKGYVMIIPSRARFLDNTKYFFLYLAKQKDVKLKKIFLFTSNKEIVNKINNKNVVIIQNKWKLFWSILKCKVLISDSPLILFLYLKRKKKVCLWHGVGLKKVHLMSPRKLNIIYSIIYKTDIFVSTSKFATKRVFSKEFNAKKFINTGYPRNDSLFRKINKLDLINTDIKIIQKVDKIKDHKIIVYMPTYRDQGGDLLEENKINLSDLNKFAKNNKIIFIFKFHPGHGSGYSLNFSNIWWYDHSKDIYPLLPKTDMLITDYSSIAYDYLLLHKPIVFFPYDFDRYIKRDRGLIFDYKEMSPGPICYNEKQLKNEILKMFKRDKYKKQRERILKLFFDHNDGKASERIYKELIELL